MVNIFSPQEILRIAIRVEENGKFLYQNLEDKAKDEKLKDVCRYLKEQEQLHQQIFEEMLKELGDYKVEEFYAGEYKAYINAIASEYIFTEELIKAKLKQNFNSDLEAVEFGIYIEKESILTYQALKEYILQNKRDTLEKVVEEEKKHLVTLVLLKDSMIKKGEKYGN